MGSAATVVAAGRYGLATVAGRMVLAADGVVLAADGVVLTADGVVLTADGMVPEAEVTTASGAAWPRGGAAACADPNSASLVA